MLSFLKKGLFRTTQSSNGEDKLKQNLTAVHDADKASYAEIGFAQARLNRGDSHALKINLNRLYQRYHEEIICDKEIQEKAKKPYRDKLTNLRARLESTTAEQKEIQEEKMPLLHQKMTEIRKKIKDIRSNPDQIVHANVNRIGLAAGTLILIALTIYLWVFYSSASYSAFFRIFDPASLAISHAIFDAKAVSKAWIDGVTELILIVAMPFIFLALGFLIHWFSEKNNRNSYLKIALLFLVTFLFDALLAYEITGKIYDLKTLSAFTADPPPYSIALAISDINFWLIIFAGFVVYIVWGIVFSFVLDGFEKLDKVKHAIRLEQEKIHGLEKEVEALDKTANEKKEQVRKYIEDIKKTEDTLGYNIVSSKIFEKRLYEFLSGWTEWLHYKRLPHETIREAHQIAELFFKNYDDNLKIIST